MSERAGNPAIATLRSILEGFGERLVDFDAVTIETRLRAKADDYRELTARLQRLTNADPRVQELRGEAKRLLDQGDFACRRCAAGAAPSVLCGPVGDGG